MARIIDVDKAIEMFENNKNDADMRCGEDGDEYWYGYKDGVSDCIFDLDEAECHDMVEVVRCAECGWSTPTTVPVSSTLTKRAWRCPLMHSTVEGDFFCAKGEKKNEAD